MLECFIMGDSIAVGVSQFKTECVSYSESGITSAGWIDKWGQYPEPAKITVISLGANDYVIDTMPNIEIIRKNLKTNRVIWLLPRQERVPKAFEAVYELAGRYGDRVIRRPPQVSSDGIHPTDEGYKWLADQIR
jgi:lysophospholipase L1-like esterase